MCILRECGDGGRLTASLTQHVAAHLKADLRGGGEAVLVVSGGRSPVAFFQAISGQPLDWARVTVTLADERWVPVDHPDSNEGLVRSHLLQGRAATARLVPLYTGEATPETAVPAVCATLDGLPRPFSQVILGMGEDGHTASLFPGAPELAVGLDTGASALAVRPPRAPHARLSLSLHSLLQSRDIALLISGPAKRRVLEEALGEGPVESLPIRAILRQTAVPVTVYWAP